MDIFHHVEKTKKDYSNVRDMDARERIHITHGHHYTMISPQHVVKNQKARAMNLIDFIYDN